MNILLQHITSYFNENEENIIVSIEYILIIGIIKRL